MRDEEKPEQPFTRFSAFTFLLVGYAVSIGIGLIIGWHAQGFMSGLTMLLPREVAKSESWLFTLQRFCLFRIWWFILR